MKTRLDGGLPRFELDAGHSPFSLRHTTIAVDKLASSHVSSCNKPILILLVVLGRSKIVSCTHIRLIGSDRTILSQKKDTKHLKQPCVCAQSCSTRSINEKHVRALSPENHRFQGGHNGVTFFYSLIHFRPAKLVLQL